MLNLNGLAEFLTFGFTLDGKTMIQEKNIPSIPMSIPKPKTNATIDDVYAALDEAMEKLIEAETGIGLSGGLDSRINAGIAAEMEEIPTFTFGVSKFEKIIAHKVASTLKLPHIIFTTNMHLNEKIIEKLKALVMETGGALDVFNLYIRTSLGQRFKEQGIKKIITAYGFDEVNCSSFGYKVGSTQEFCNVLSQAYAHPSLPFQYREIVKKNLIECCSNIPFRVLYPLVWIKNVIKKFDVRDWVRTETPIVDRKVLSAITSVPYEKRIYKRIQKAILRKYFPKLYKIPYAASGLPPFFHHYIHNLMNRSVLALFAFQRSPQPLHTWDIQWFIRLNLSLFKKLLVSNVPPFMSRGTVRNLIYRMEAHGNDLDANFLNRLITYALLSSQMNS